MRKILILLLATYVLSAEDGFSWFSLKKDLNIGETSQEKLETKGYIRSQYGVNVEKKDYEDMKEEQRNKPLSVGFTFFPVQEYYNKDNELSKTDFFGIYIRGKLSFDMIGYPLKKWYTNIALAVDYVDIIFDYQWAGKYYGFFASFGMGLKVQIQETMYKKGMYQVVKASVGYLGEDFGAELMYLVDNATVTAYNSDYGSKNRDIMLALFKRF